jgi:FG-GAP-like repeat
MAYAVPILTGLTTPVTFLENAVNAAPQLIDAHVSFTAAGNPTNFNGGTLTVTGLLPEDTVAIRNQGTSFSQIGISGSNVIFGPVVLGGGVTVIGSFAGGDGSTLTVTFNANAFTAAIEALIENLTYANSSDTPTASRSLELKVTDAAGFAASGIEFAAQTGLANPFNGVDVGNSSTPSLADLDGDGDLDAVVGASNGILHYFENTGSAIAAAFTERTGAANPFNGIDVGLFSAPAFADLDGDGDLDAVVGQYDGSLRYFENTGSATAPAFTERAGAANPIDFGTVLHYSAPSFGDLDGDGDLDAVAGSINGRLAYFENTGSATAPVFYPVSEFSSTNPFVEIDVGSASTPSLADLDGDGDVDAIVGVNNGNLNYIRSTRPHQPAPGFVEQTGAANPFDHGVDVGSLSKPSFADLDGDGDLDAVVGTGDGILRYFENTGSATAPAFTERTGVANPFDGAGFDVGLNSAPSFADLDGDGDLDAVVGTGDGILRYFENIGSALAPAFTEQTGLANPFNGVDVGDSSTPSLADLDRDGDLDAVVGTGDGILRYFENTGSALAPAFTEQTGTDNPFNGLDVGINSTPSFADLDRDGDLDAVVGESNGILHYFENTGSAITPAFTERTGAANPLNGIDAGLFSAPTFADLDGDGDLDPVIGENGGSLKYFENTGAGFALVVNVTAQNDAAVPDFSSDSKSDILWQSGSGTAAAWLMDGTSSTSVGAIGSFNPGPAWHIKATGDFNGDSKSDIVWQGDTGAAALWLLDGTNVTFAGQIGPFNPGPSWQIKDTGDFNGDGKSDIIWQGNDGTAAMWLMDGPNATFAGAVGSNPGPSWQIKGTGDFNGDGKSDILWQGQDGTPAVWLMDGTHATFVGAVGPFNPGPSWEIKGTGDFNGDGKADIIWQNDNGTPAIWLMDGTNVTSAGAVGPFNPGPSWHIEGTGDFNGDSKADILWQNDDGTPAIWTMDGTNVVSIGAAGSFNPGPIGTSSRDRTDRALGKSLAC